MKQLLHDSITQIISGIVVAAILSTIGVLGLDNQYKEIAGKVLIVTWYAILWGGVLYVFLAKRSSQFDATVKLPKFPALYKFLSFSIIVLATVLLIWSFVSNTIPPLVLEINNTQDYDIGISPQADLIIDSNVPMFGLSQLGSGRIQLSLTKNGDTRNELIIVPAKSKIIVYGKLADDSQLKKYWEKEYVFATVFFYDKEGQLFAFSGAVPFNKEMFNHYILPVEVPQ